MPDNEPELDPFARELFNEITPANVVKLNYWLAGVILVVMAFMFDTRRGDELDRARDQATDVNVEKLSAAVGALTTAQITTGVGLDSHRTLHQNDQDDTDRRFLEIITRLDEAIARIR